MAAVFTRMRAEWINVHPTTMRHGRSRPATGAIRHRFQGSETMRVAILGNSGSGKSTLAKWMAAHAGLMVLDLDSVAWEPGQPPVMRSSARAEADVANFCTAHERWVLEGCYASLIEAAFRFEPLLIFLNPGFESCAAHCMNRPWEPHKYPSKQEQDANLPPLLAWVAAYYTRDGTMSLAAHRALFDRYPGRKVEVQRMPRLNPPEDWMLAWVTERE